MYFRKPEQLQDLFEALEENNLFIMKNIQEIEQNIENLRHNFDHKKVKLLEQEKLNQKNKQELSKILKVKYNVISPFDNLIAKDSNDTANAET